MAADDTNSVTISDADTSAIVSADNAPLDSVSATDDKKGLSARYGFAVAAAAMLGVAVFAVWELYHDSPLDVDGGIYKISPYALTDEFVPASIKVNGKWQQGVVKRTALKNDIRAVYPVGNQSPMLAATKDLTRLTPTSRLAAVIAYTTPDDKPAKQPIHYAIAREHLPTTQAPGNPQTKPGETKVNVFDQSGHISFAMVPQKYLMSGYDVVRVADTPDTTVEERKNNLALVENTKLVQPEKRPDLLIARSGAQEFVIAKADLMPIPRDQVVLSVHGETHVMNRRDLIKATP